MRLGNKFKKRILRSIRVAALTGAVTMFSATAIAAVANDALPTGGQFMGASSGTIMSANGVMNVNQATQNAAIKWDTFNVGANATINFTQNGGMTGAYNILNYSANGGKASEIYGRMKAGAEANVWLVNPNGVLIGKGAQIDVGHMHMATHTMDPDEFNSFVNDNQHFKLNDINHTNAELMSMGNLYVNSISFDGDRVVLDADKLFTYAGDKVELGDKGKLNKNDSTDHMVHQVDDSGNMLSALVNRVYMGEKGALKDINGDDVANNTGTYAQAAATKGGNTWTGDALNDNSYLTIGKHAREVVVGYTVYDEKANAAIAGEKGSYENSANWRALYTTLEGKSASERVGFAWVEDSKQLERIGEGVQTLSRDFALKDGIAAIGTQEYNSGKGFQPIGADLTDPHSSHHTAFTGKFDGLIYDIYGLTINRPDENDIGLFGHVGDGAVIRNVNLVSGSIVGNNNVGGVVGHAVGNVTLENVVNSSLVLGVNNVGGIAGKTEGTSAAAPVKIINAENVSLIRGNTNVGGIVGNASNTTVTGESYNTGAVRGIVNYKVADSAYASKEAYDLTSAKYDVDGGYSVGSQVVYKVGGVKKAAFVKTLDSSGNPASYVDKDGNDVTSEALNATRLLVRIEAATDKGTSNMNDASKKVYKNVFEARGSHDVGGLVGTGKNVAIGNVEDPETGKLFEIYNGVEILGGYNIAGIAGSIAKSDAGSNIANVIQNVANRGSIVAKGFDSEAYYYQSRFYANGTNVSAYVNASDTNMNTLNNTYYGEETLKDSDWVKGNYMKQTVAVANVGGIVGLAEGSAAAVTNIKNVSNYADVKSDTKTEAMTIVKYDTSLNAQVATDYETTYSLGGNVGGIVGKATSGTISGVNTNSNRNGVSTSSGGGTGVIVDYATNKENFVLGAHNVGGIVGYGFNATVKNSVNDGGDISMTGARNQDQFTSVIGRYANGLNMWDYGFSHEISRGTVVQRSMYADYVTGNVGGIIGYMFGDDSYVQNSRNRGYIHTQDLEEDGVRRISNEAANVGGIVGKVGRSRTLNWSNTTLREFNDTAKVAIKSSSNEGKVSGYSGIGGVVGQMYNGEIMTSKNLGNVVSSFAQNSFNEQANMGGILGDTPAGDANDGAKIKIYDSFNEGVIGDPTFETYGRHVGGIVGRLLGEVSKVYNVGDMYTGSDNIGGIVGYVQTGGVYNVYNKGNITNYVKTDNAVKVGGIVGRFEGGGNVNDAYNLGIIRSFIDNHKATDVSHLVGGIIAENGSANNVYSTGEIYAAHTNASGEWVKSSNGIGGIKPGGGSISNYRVVLAEDPSLWSLTDSASADYTIEYKNRYNMNEWTTRSQALQNVVKEDTTDKVINRTDSKFRMYLYDKADGVSVTYGSNTDTVIKDGVTYTRVNGTADQYRNDSTTITVVGSMPILNKYVPYVYGGYDRNTAGYLGSKIGSGADDIKYIQVGTEYNPLQLNIVMNTAGKTLDVDYATAEMARAAHINVQNGNLNLHNINDADFFLAGIYVALNGNVTVAGSAERLNISSNTNIIGQSANIINLSGSIENNATVNATAGNVKIQGQGITNYGSITALGKDDAPVVVKGINVTPSNTYATAGKTIAEVNALKAKISDYNVQLNNKGVDVYSSTVAAPTINGNVEFTTKIADKVTGDVNLYLGNNKLGKISTEGNLTVVGDNVYSDSDYRIGYGEHASTKWIVNGNDIVLDFSNIASTVETSAITQDLINAAWTGETVVPKPTAGDEFTPAQREVLKRVMLHHMVSDFSTTNTKGNEIAFAGTNGTSATNAMLVMNYFDDNNVLNLNRYDTSSTNLFDSLATLKVKNGGTAIDARTIGYAWVENAEQLLGIQKAFEGDATEMDRINELKLKKQNGTITGDATTGEVKELNDLIANHVYNENVMAMNYALKNDIDASDLPHFVSIGLKADGTDTAFTGTFDGRDHDLNSLSPSDEIEGVKVENSTGLFSTIGTTGTVKDLYINSSQLVAHSTRVGLVAGTNKGTIDNVRTFGNTVKDANTVTNNPVFIGGLVGFNDQSGKIINSITEDIVYSENEKGQSDVGGVAGLNAGIIYESTGKSDVSVAEGGATSLGGVAGVNAGLLKDVVSLGVTAGLYEHADGTYTGAMNVGGIAGENRTVYDTKEGVVHTQAIDYTIEGETFKGGVIADAYNDSKVKGWSNTGGIVGKNFGAGDSLNIKTQTGVTITTNTAADMFYIANAADVIAGDNAGGLAGVNNGAIKGATGTTTTVVDAAGIAYTINNTTGKVTSSAGTAAQKEVAEKFYAEYIQDTDKALGQTIYGRNAGKITAKSGLVDYDTTKKHALDDTVEILKTTGTNVGGLIGISGPKADVDHLLNGKAASVYGKVNVGGLIGLNQGILQHSVNLMQNNEISGALNVGGIVGENSGIIAKIENTNKFNITVNDDYVNLTNGALLETISYGGVNYTPGAYNGYASYFGGILGHNAAVGTAQGANAAEGGIVADVVNTANVTIEHPANYVGGIMGSNDGTIGYADKVLYGDVKADGYLRNDGAVGVINGSQRGNFIGGVIGQNNKDIYMTDITNSIKGTVYGYNYVGGIVGQNNAVISGGRDQQEYANRTTTAEKGNYYKYDVYNNGMVTGTTNVGGLIGDNAGTGTIKLAYNTGVVKGGTDVGGIVGSNEGVVDQVFNSTAPFDKEGKNIAAADLGVHGNTNVGGLVGVNAGAISNAYNTGNVDGSTATGSVVGKNSADGTMTSSYATDTAKKLVGTNANVSGLSGNYSMAVADASTAGVTYLDDSQKLKTSSYTALNSDNWAFYNNAATPLLKNFLTKAYFVPNENFGDAFTYNALHQGAGIKVENGHVNVYKVVDGAMTTTKVGEIFAADASGDHSLADYMMTRANSGSQLIVGNQNGLNADRYDMLYSAQINTNYKQDNWVNKDGVPEKVVNPNMLGYEFFEAKIEASVPYNPEKPIYDPSRPDYIPNPSYDPSDPSSPQIIPNSDKNPDDAVKPEDANPKIPTGTDFVVPADPKAPTYDINRVVLSFTANDVERIYGELTLNGPAYTPVIAGKDADNQIVAAQEAALMAALGTPSTPDLSSAAAGSVTDTSLSNLSGKTTNGVNGNYHWTSSTTVNGEDNKDLLANYTFAESMKNTFGEKEPGVAYTWQEKLGVDNSGVMTATGKVTVTPAELTINLNSFDVVYGATGATNVAATFGGTDTVANAQIKETHTGVTNGDSFASLVAVTAENINNGAFTDATTLDHTSNVGTYSISLKDGVITDVKDSLGGHQYYTTNDGNYKVTVTNGTVKVSPKVLEVATHDVERVYGDAAMTAGKDVYYNAATDITGWVYGEGSDSAITSKIQQVGAINDGALAAPNTAGKITNDAGNHTWSAQLTESLDNYVLKAKGAADSTIADGSLSIGANSVVKKKDLTVVLNSFDIVYGARLEETTGDSQATKHNLYGEGTYVDNVASLYKATNTNMVNGDDVSTVIASIVRDRDAGFDTATYDDGVNVYKKTFYATKADEYNANVTLTTHGDKNYNIIDVTPGQVNVKHAVIEAEGGGDIYRYYGEAQKYVLDGTTLKKATADFGITGVTGVVYDDDLTGKLNITTTGSAYDDAMTASDPNATTTNNVGAYTWGGGSINAIDTTDFTDTTDVLHNYRFWDETGKTVTTSATTITGGGSYVLPQIVNVTLKDQTIEYGTAKGDAASTYAGSNVIKLEAGQYAINGTLQTAGTSFVNSATGALTANGDTDVNIVNKLGAAAAGDIVYVEGKAYVGDKTNNVNGGTPYADAIQLKTAETGTVLKKQTVSFIPISGDQTYISLGDNKNYAVNIIKGSATITPKKLTMTDLASTITYGEANREIYGQLNVTGGVLDTSRIAYSDDEVALSLSGQDIVEGGNNYITNRDGRNTGDAGVYTNALQANVALTGAQAGNYMLVNNLSDTAPKTVVNGNLTVEKANLVVKLNDFKVLYGDTKASQTINADYTRNDAATEKVSVKELGISDSLGLVNGDETDIAKVLTITGVDNGAFETKADGVTVGTVAAGNDKVLSATSIKDTKTGATVTVSSGSTSTKNYNVTVVDGSVDVLAKQVVVIDPGKDAPNHSDPSDPFKPGTDDPKEKFNPDAVYITTNDVERTYGSTDITSGEPAKVTITGLAKWDTDDGSGKKVITPAADPTHDGGLDTATTTNKAGDYKWDTTLDTDDITDLGSSYVIPTAPGATTVTVEGGSKVNRAKLTIKLSDILNVTYGTAEPTSYAAAEAKDGVTVGSNTYNTTYIGETNGLAKQDAGKTYADLFTYTDENTGYIGGVGQDVYKNGNPVTYHHNAINASSDKGVFSVASTTGSTSFNNPYDNVGTVATGVSSDGNYDVAILSGKVTFTKADLTINSSDIIRTYGDTIPKTGSYDATIDASGLASWDAAKDKTVIVTGITDGGLVSTTKTNNAGDYTWSGSLDADLIPDWVKNNYNFSTSVGGKSTVDRANLEIKLNNFSILYGDTKDKNVIGTDYVRATGSGTTIAEQEKMVFASTEEGKGLVNGDKLENVFSLTTTAEEKTGVHNHAYNHEGQTLNANTTTGYDIYAASTNLRTDGLKTELGTAASGDTGHVVGGISQDGNYNVTIVKGNVKVLPKKVAVVDEIPTPTTPGYDPDKVYVAGNTVVRTYGDTTIKQTTDNPQGVYQATISGLAHQDVSTGQKTVNFDNSEIGHAKDEGLTAADKTNDVKDTYKWNHAIDTSLIGGFGTNYVLDDAGKTDVLGKSIVTKATLNVYLNDLHITYGDDYSLYNQADTYRFEDADGNAINGSSVYLNGDTYNSIITVDSLTVKNGGYNDAKTRTQDAGTLNLFSDATASTALTGTTPVNTTENDVAKRYLYGESNSGNYDVYVHSGKVDIAKKQITYNTVDATVTYNNKEHEGGPLYIMTSTAPTLSGKAYADDVVELHYNGIAVKDGSSYDTANKAKPNSTTANVGDYKESAILDNASLTGAAHQNYELVAPKAGTITVTPMKLDVSDFSSTIIYGSDSTQSANYNITNSGALVGDIVSGDKVTLVTTGMTKGYAVGSEFANNMKGDKTPDVKVIVNDGVHAIQDYNNSLSISGLTLTGDDAKNYEITGTAGGTIKVLPKQLTVKTNDVTRVYGNATETIKTGTPGNEHQSHNNYVNVTGWVTGEEGLASKLVVEGFVDKAVAGLTKPNQKTNDVGDYTWNGKLHSYEALHNYTFADTNDTYKEIMDISGNSYVTPFNFSIDINSVNMIYGATENKVGDKAALNNHYENAGLEVYQNNVKSAYGFDLKFLVNGDTLEEVIGKSANELEYSNKGFSSETYTDAANNEYNKTKDVGNYAKALDFTAATKSAIENAVNNNKNYKLTAINAGDVEVKHALISTEGGTIYRYYGDNTKYKLENGALTTPADYHHEGVSGWVYGDDFTSKISVSDPHATNDGALSTEAGKVTNKVGNYAWEEGTISMTAADAAGALKNYRIWDDATETAGLVGDIGGASIVLPKEITIDIANQTIVYGSEKAGNLAAYAPNMQITEGGFVNGDSTTLADYVGSTVNYDYVVGKAYLENGHTNNVNNQTPYKEAITITGEHGLTTATQSNAYVGVNKTYTTFKDNQNYAVKFTGGDVTITPKKVTVEDFSGSITYGDKRGNDGIQTIGGVKLDGIVYDDNVTLKPGTLDVTGTYKDNLDYNRGLRGDSVTTADVGTYKDSLIKGVGLIGDAADNYVLIDKVTNQKTDEIRGTITVNQAEITVNMNNFSVIYGMNKDSLISVNGEIMTVAQAEKVLNYADGALLNGDKISDVVNINPVDNQAFYNDGVQWKTKDANDKAYTLTGTTDLEDAAYNSSKGITTGGSKLNKNNLSNYKVTVVDGSVTVDARPVVVIPPGQDVPEKDPQKPYKPGDDPTKVWSPDVVYVTANTVERTYGDTTITSDNPYQVTMSGLAYQDTSVTVTVDKILTDGGVDKNNSHYTTNAREDYKWTGDISDQFDSNYALKDVVTGGSKVNKAKLELDLNSIHGIVYGVSEDLLTYSNSVNSNSTYANGLATQDLAAGMTIAGGSNALLSYADENTGYPNGEGVKDFKGKTFNHNAVNTNLLDAKTTVNKKVEGISANGNYDVIINSGTITFQNRPVVVVDPEAPTPTPVPKPNLNDPNDPHYHPSYDPTNPNDPYNQVFVQAGIVERIYGDPTKDKPYQVTIVGTPEWDNLNGIKDVTDKVTSDFGLKDGVMDSPYTNNVGKHDWNANLKDVLGGLGGYELPENPVIVGLSKVDRAELVVKIQDTAAKKGEAFGDYDFDLNKVANGDDADSIKKIIFELGGSAYENKKAENGIAVGEVGHYAGELGFIKPIADINEVLGNYVVKYLPGDVTIKASDAGFDPVEDLYPWLHRTNNDHGWGHQEHWRERKAEVNYVEGGADFFNDATAAEAADDEALKS